MFRYRFEGQALSTKEAVKLTRRIGELLYVPRLHDPRPGRSLMIAMLLADDQESYVIGIRLLTGVPHAAAPSRIA